MSFRTFQSKPSFFKKKIFFALMASLTFSMGVKAAAPAPISPDNLNDTIKYAIENNPEVQAQWHNFLASEEVVNQASAEFKPTIDFFADYSIQHKSYTQKEDFSGASAKLTLSQMLYDGDKTRQKTETFKNEALVQYFELLSKVENTALDAYTAYQDVLRYRKLTAIAQQNFVNHLDVYKKISAGVETGATRRADLEQISGRLALAESNLLTEKANLHDVSSRFLRIVGSIPAKDLTNVNFNNSTLPTTFHDVMNSAYEHNAAFNSAIRNIEAKRTNVEQERSGYMPRLDLTGEAGYQTYDLQGYDNDINDRKLALEFRYNLFNGHQTDSAVNEAQEKVSQAKYLREKACVDMRQNLQISYNDVRKLNDQMPILNQHLDASDKVRIAFKDQFSIGQRTLLDLLDTEIEFFQAGRAYANAVYDRNISTAKTLAEMGKLLSTLKVVRNGLPSLSDLGAEPLPLDPESTCPIAEIPDYIGDIEQPTLPVIAPKFKVPKDDSMSNIYELTVNFKFDSAIIDEKYYNDIAELAKFLKENPTTKVQIQGHASQDGPEVYNQWLSERRAQAVSKELTQTYEIDPSRVSSVGFGETRPLIDAMTPEALRSNRRVESEITLIIEQ